MYGLYCPQPTATTSPLAALHAGSADQQQPQRGFATAKYLVTCSCCGGLVLLADYRDGRALTCPVCHGENPRPGFAGLIRDRQVGGRVDETETSQTVDWTSGEYDLDVVSPLM